MVWLFDRHIVEFPKFEFYLQNLSNDVQDNERIWQAFLKWSQLDVASAVDCLSYGTYPIIKIPGLFDSAHDYGHFNPKDPNYIKVRRDKIQSYSNGTDATRIYQDGKYLEMLILHELVHWGRHWMARDDSEDNPDSGRRFAMEAYNDVYNPHL